jgi:UDP-N-acetylmuramate dehydrogenase
MQLASKVPLATLTSLRLGGPARQLAVLDDPRDFPDLAGQAAKAGTCPYVIGDGTNLLAADDGYPGLAVRMATAGTRFARSPGDGTVLVTVQAGHELQALVDEAIEEGLSGIECLTGIPGTAGATPVQNVGAYGQEIADTIAGARAWDWEQARHVELTPAQCALGHRTSAFKHSRRWTILTVTLGLTPSTLGPPITYHGVADAAGVRLGERATMKETAAAVRDVRAKKGMILDPRDPDGRTAGSVFLSPAVGPAASARLRDAGAPVNAFPDGTTRVPASWLIMTAGFSLGQQLARGTRISGRQYTLVADDGATAASFTQAAVTVAERVEQQTGITLTAELDLIGDLPLYSELTQPPKTRAT